MVDSGWERYRVENLVAAGVLVVNDGYRAKNSELSDEGLPFARAGNVNNGFDFRNADRFPAENIHRVGMKVSRSGDVLFTSKGTVGRFGFVREDTEQFVYSPQLCFWRVRDRSFIDPRFLYYWMHGTEFQEQCHGVKSQTDMAEYVSLRDQRRMHITSPDLDVQRAIASVLGALDDKIELNHRMNETLEEMARALFKSWFVDFDPVRAKMEGRRPAGMDDETANLFPDSFEDSALGEIPKRWSVGTMAEYADLNPESWSKGNAPSQVAYIDLANTKWGKIDQPQTFLWKDAPSRACRVLRTGDTVVGTVRPGNGSYALIQEEGKTGSTGFAVLRPRNTIYEEFVYLVATASKNIDRLSRLADGAAYPAVRPGVVMDTEAPLPNEALLEHFSRIAKPLMEKAAANREENRILAAIRDVLLPKLLSGEIRVREEAVEETA